MSKPTERDIENLAGYLIALPFWMRNMGHRTIKGYAVYVHGQPLLEATLQWLARQTDDAWDNLIEAWGGEEVVRDIQRALMQELVGFMRKAADELGKDKEVMDEQQD